MARRTNVVEFLEQKGARWMLFRQRSMDAQKHSALSSRNSRATRPIYYAEAAPCSTWRLPRATVKLPRCSWPLALI